ncbi:hypothetical protein Lgra_3399 [Legionella gratiana]|uniref:Uncharacterized protein n=1 Tax=Legionella gratiana TaxID=45066 RepID=A0A378JGE6_9GAMM|nr:hypothetical protein [Legionella gratiana]KTD05435.1 hypothetical protein Lgra_3399 [Legionella gratiana]STX46061.1 Uncharacterised protein [Legionella gratiana]
MRSVHKAMGSLKDHLTYCSIPGAAALLPAYGDMTGFSSDCNKAYLSMQQHSMENSAHRQENRNTSHHIEPLRSFEPYTRICLQFASLSQTLLIFKQRSRAHMKHASLLVQKIKAFWPR